MNLPPPPPPQKKKEGECGLGVSIKKFLRNFCFGLGGGGGGGSYLKNKDGVGSQLGH